VEAAVPDQTLDRHHGAVAALDAEDQARQDRLTVEEDGARAALAELAAVLGAGEVQIFTQDLEQRLVWRERDLRRLAVDGQRDLDVRLNAEGLAP
jgi:hypothetical protein